MVPRKWGPAPLFYIVDIFDLDMGGHRRGATSTTATILMVAVTIVVVGAVGIPASNLANSQNTSPPSAAFDTEQDGDTLRITHIGGQSLAGKNLELQGAQADIPKTVKAGTTIESVPTQDRVKLIWKSEKSDTSTILLDIAANPAGGESIFNITDTTVGNGLCAGGRATGTGSATIVNEGSIEDTQTVTLSVDGAVVRQEQVTLAPGEQTTVTFSSVTVQTNDCEVNATVSTEDDSSTRKLPGLGVVAAVVAIAVWMLLKKRQSEET